MPILGDLVETIFQTLEQAPPRKLDFRGGGVSHHLSTFRARKGPGFGLIVGSFPTAV